MCSCPGLGLRGQRCARDRLGRVGRERGRWRVWRAGPVIVVSEMDGDKDERRRTSFVAASPYMVNGVRLGDEA